MNKSIFQNQYPFIQISLPGRNEIFVMQTTAKQWIVQIIQFATEAQYKAFAYGKPDDVYQYDKERMIAAQAVSPVQEVNITLDNMKEENEIQAQAERDALSWWIAQQQL